MGVMNYLDILEDELLANKSLKLDKKDNKTVAAICWFQNTCNSENYSGIFKNIHLNFKEGKRYVYITISDEDYEKVYNNTMSGLKESLTDIVDILKDIKKEEKEDVN